MRRTVLTLVVLIAALVVGAAGYAGGVSGADGRWVDDVGALGEAVRRLDADLRAGAGPAGHDPEYFARLSGLPLEGCDGGSATYYVGPAKRRSATIAFDRSGVTGLTIR